MPIFHRRTIQRMLRELPSDHFPADRVSQWVKRLNNGPALDAIGAEWEVSVVHAFSRLGKTQSEELYGKRRPDVIFFGDQDRPIFVADICCPSRDQFEMSNPIGPFTEAFWKLIKKEGFNPEWFNVHVNRKPFPPGFYENRKHYKDSPAVILHLPQEQHFRPLVFNEEFYAFLGKIRSAPEAQESVHILNEHANVEITYEPGKRNLSSGYASFDLVTDLKQNAVYRALKSKAKQLKDTGLACCKGIIVCDGGHPLLSVAAMSNMTYSLREILNEFFSEYSSIDVVVVLGVETPWNGKPRIEPIAMSRVGLDGLPSGLGETLDQMQRRLPVPIRGARNAVTAWENRSHERTGFLWSNIEYRHMRVTAKISAQSLLKLMAGRVTVEELFSALPDRPRKNEFAKILEQGYVLTDVRFEENPDEDHDWLHLEFSGPDASVGPFSN